MQVDVLKSRRPTATRTIAALILREMTTTYGRSPGGYLWAVLEPIAAIALLSYVFSLALRAPSLGDSFPLFYATGYLPYMLFHDVANKCAKSIRFSRPLLNFGAVTVIDVILARFLLNLLTHLLIFGIVLGGLIWVFDPPTTLSPFPILVAISMAGTLALGVGTINAYLFTAFPVWEQIWTVLTRPLFILSGVFFIFEDVPSSFQFLLAFNPLFHVTGEMRAGFYSIYDATYVIHAYPYAVGVALFFLGLMLLYRHKDDLIER